MTATVAGTGHAWLHTDDATGTGSGSASPQPEPVGYDPAIIHAWQDGPLTPGFAALRLEGEVDLVRDWAS